MDKELGVLIRAKGAAQASRDVKGVDQSIGHLTTRAGTFATTLKTNVGSALSTFGGRLKGAAAGVAAFAGVGGLLGLSGILVKSISEAATFGANVANVSRVTGLAIPVASSMVDTLDKWGVSSDRLIPLLGKLEKNLGVIAGTAKGATKFHKEFGVSLVDNHGKILDANTLLLKSADYFNSNASASKKATFLAKLYGKQWQDLVPILSKGSAFIRAQETDSIKLTQTQLDNITKYRSASRDFADTVGDIEVKIGANLMPLLTQAMSTVSGWLDTHGDDIASFFGNAATLAGTAASGAIGVFNAVKTGWESIPGPFRDILVKGIVADRTVKFLFGFSPIGAAIHGIEGGIGNAVGSGLAKAGLGKLFVQPVFVTNPGFGAGGLAGAGEGAAAAGGMGLLAATAALGITAAALIGAAELIRQKVNPNSSGELFQSHTAQEAAAHHLGVPVAQVLGSDKVMGELDSIRQAIVTRPEVAAQAKTMAAVDKVREAINTRGEVMAAKLQMNAERASQIRNAINSKRMSVSVAPHVTVRDTTRVRVDAEWTVGGSTSSSSSNSTSQASSDSRFSGYTRELASGGRYRPGQPRLTGEHGPELDIPTGPGDVFSAGDTRSLRSLLRGGMGAMHVTVAAHFSARQVEGASHRQAGYGPTRVRQLGYSG